VDGLFFTIVTDALSRSSQLSLLSSVSTAVRHVAGVNVSSVSGYKSGLLASCPTLGAIVTLAAFPDTDTLLIRIGGVLFNVRLRLPGTMPVFTPSGAVGASPVFGN